MSTTFTKRKPMWLASFLPVAFIGLLIIYLLNTILDRSLFASGDGYLMQYTTAVYAKDFWTSLLQGNLPLMDFTLGEGLDPILSMAYYGLLDPFNLIYLIVPNAAIPTVGSMLVLLKILFGGLAFGFYAKQHTDDDKAVSIGALVYTFAGYSLLWMVSPGLLAACYLFPVALYAMDVAFDKQKYIWLSLATAWCYITNYYIGVAISFMLLAYAVLRIVMNNQWNVKALLNYCKTAIAHALGIMATAAILVPVAVAILGGSRDGTAGGYRDSLLWFNWEYYLNFFGGLFTPFADLDRYFTAPYQMTSHFACIAAPALTLFLGYQTEPGTKERRLKWSLLLSLIFVCVPAFGILFNGGMYATHRWAFAFAMIIGLIVVWAVPRLHDMPKWSKIVSAILLIGSNVAAIWTTTTRVAIISLITSAIISIIMLWKPRRLTAYIATVLSIVMMIGTTFAVSGYSASFSPINLDERSTTGIYSAVELTEADLEEFIRTAITDTSIAPNDGMLLGLNTTTGVWNIMPDGVCEFNCDTMMLPNTDTDFWVSGWDDRTAPHVLAGAKYFITTKEKEACVPYGFNLIYSIDIESTVAHDEKVTTYLVYANSTNPSVGYMFYNSMSTEQFYSLNIADRQIAMMQYAIYDDAAEINHSAQAIELTPEVREKQNGRLTTTIMDVTVPRGYELYLYCENVSLVQDLDKVVLNDNYTTYSTEDGVSTTHVTVQSTNESGQRVLKSMLANRPNAHLTSGTTFRAVNLGYQMFGDITIKMQYCAEYIQVQGVKLLAVPVDEYHKAAQNLEKNQLFDVEFGENTLQGKISTAYDGVLQIAVPYSTGWKAFIDGQPVETFKSGIKYIGIQMPAGEHEVRLEYTTPGFGWGMMLSVTAIFVMCIWFAMEYASKIKSLFNHPKYASLCRYLVCGCATTLLDLAIYLGLSGFGLLIPIAKFTSGALTTIVSFFLNRTWSFSASSGNAANQGWKFIITQLLNISTNTLVNSLVLAIVDVKLIAFCFATLAGMTVSFLLQRCWVFRQKGEQAQ